MRIADGTAPVFSWNLVADFREMWSYPFMVNAFRAGTIAAVVSATVGWFMVLRRQTFAGHTLSVVTFPGASLAVLLGIPVVLGYFGACVTVALLIAARPRVQGDTGGAEAAITGTLQAFALACGFLFVTLYKGLLGGPQALLFGSFLGITTTQVAVLAAVATGVLAVLSLIGRPLLFASADPAVAAARGVPVRLLGAVFLVLLGAAAAEASQITGALLVLALMVVPAAAAQELTANPALSLAIAVAIAVACCWGGLVAAYYQPYPIGFFVTTIAFGVYVLVRLARAAATAVGRARRPHAAAAAS
ncbi:MAG: metal ABC transporter permease [Streptomycetaceae bacterium]|jgi:zinc/manganese transport system permease protein|nr:metal ABC transporter permease [Streptomycetaceae bacterium]